MVCCQKSLTLIRWTISTHLEVLCPSGAENTFCFIFHSFFLYPIFTIPWLLKVWLWIFSTFSSLLVTLNWPSCDFCSSLEQRALELKSFSSWPHDTIDLDVDFSNITKKLKHPVFLKLTKWWPGSRFWVDIHKRGMGVLHRGVRMVICVSNNYPSVVLTFRPSFQLAESKAVKIRHAFRVPLKDCLAGLTGSSTQAGTGCTILQLIGSSVADCQALTWHIDTINRVCRWHCSTLPPDFVLNIVQ